MDPRELRRADFPVLWPLQTRWSDEDAYGHLNNAVHYLLFDTAVNAWLMSAVGRDVRDLDALGVVAETSCRYLAELRFPEPVTCGLVLERAGHSAVTYGLALFGPAEAPAAIGRFVHVYVDRATRRPVAIPEPVRAALDGLRPASGVESGHPGAAGEPPP